MQLPERFIYYRLVAKPDSPKMDKVPCNAAGDSINPHDPSQWMTRAVADAGRNDAVSGIGFVLNGDGWFCIDLDNCRNATTGEWNAAAVAIYQSFNGALAEVSVSGTGLHIFGRCDPSRLADRRNKWDGWCEWYHTGRFIALGPHGIAPIGAWVDRDWTDQLLRLVPQRADANGVLPEGVDPAYTGPEDDTALVALMLRSVSNAARFGGTATVRDLWEGNVAVLSRIYPAYDGGGGFDRSAADAALMSHLAFWTGKDLPRMDRLFRQSALMRDKYNQREDYRRDTIHGAARMCKRVYDTPRVPSAAGGGAAAPAGGEAFLTVPEMIEHFKGCVYIRDSHRVLVPDGALLKPEQFNATYGGHMFQMLPDGTKPTKKAFEALTECMAHKFPSALRSTFRADLPPGEIIDDEVNVYVKPNVDMRPMNIDRFTDFLRRLLPNARDRDILIAWCAAVVQHPGVKFQWAPVLQGVEGNGKSLIASVLVYALGENYAYEPRASQLGSQFISFDENKLLVICEEIHMNGRRELLDDLKPRITNRRIEVEAKGQDKRMIRNTANWFFCTNYRDAVLKSRNDRRYAIFFTAQQSAADIERDGLSGGYFPALYSWLRLGGYAGVAHWLANYSIPDALNPATDCHRAPETSSTDEAVAVSAGGIEAEILEAVDSDTVGFRGGWISSHMLDRLLRDRGVKVARPRLGSILTDLGYKQWGRAPRIIMREDGKRPVLWVKGDPARDYCESQGPGYQ